jgi:hypothetical protein
VFTESNVNCLYVFYTIFWPENDPCLSKHVALINTKNLVVLTALVCTSYLLKPSLTFTYECKSYIFISPLMTEAQPNFKTFHFNKHTNSPVGTGIMCRKMIENKFLKRTFVFRLVF